MPVPRIFWDNRFTDGTVVASSVAAGDYSAANLGAFRTYRRVKPSAIPATFTVDCGVAKAADSLFVHTHDLFTNGNTVEIRGSTDNFSASNVLVHSYTPTSNAAFARTWATQSFRYWRLGVTGGTLPTLTVVVLGSRLELQGILTPDSFDPTSRVFVGTTHKNELGQPMGKIRDFIRSEQTVTMRRVPWEWIRSTWVPAWESHLASEPVGWQWNANVDPEPLFVQLGDAMDTPPSANRFADLSFTLDAVR